MTESAGWVGTMRSGLTWLVLYPGNCNFSTSFPKMGGKAYGSRTSQDRLSASTNQARGSGTGDTKWVCLNGLA